MCRPRRISHLDWYARGLASQVPVEVHENLVVAVFDLVDEVGVLVEVIGAAGFKGLECELVEDELRFGPGPCPKSIGRLGDQWDSLCGPHGLSSLRPGRPSGSRHHRPTIVASFV